MTVSKIVSDPNVLKGAPVIEGTTIPAEHVVSAVYAGTSKSEILQRFSSMPEDGISACLEWHKNGRVTEEVEAADEVPTAAMA